MNGRFGAAAAAVALCVGLCAQGAEGQTVGEPLPVEAATPKRRTLVVFAVKGSLDPEVDAALRRLLGAELRAAGLGLSERAASEPLSVWVRRAESEETPLLAAVLQVERDRLRLIVIDSARGRAIARELPGGVDENAANVEAVVTILLSASRALLEGLEVASTPVDTMLGESAPARPVATKRPPVPAPPRKTAEIPAPEPDSPPATVHASVAGTLTTFAEVEDVAPGITVAGALTLPLGLELRLSGMRQRSATVTTDFGAFALERFAMSLGAGLIFRSGAVTLIPEAALVGEWLVRADAKPAPGISASASRTLPRFGAELGARARFTFLPPLSAEVGTGVAYFGRSIRFTVAGDDETELVRLAPLALGARLGLDVAFE